MGFVGLVGSVGLVGATGFVGSEGLTGIEGFVGLFGSVGVVGSSGGGVTVPPLPSIKLPVYIGNPANNELATKAFWIALAILFC